jgi:hypothetical protein
VASDIEEARAAIKQLSSRLKESDVERLRAIVGKAQNHGDGTMTSAVWYRSRRISLHAQRLMDLFKDPVQSEADERQAMFREEPSRAPMGGGDDYDDDEIPF